jgi:hypothetical protein
MPIFHLFIELGVFVVMHLTLVNGSTSGISPLKSPDGVSNILIFYCRYPGDSAAEMPDPPAN